VLAFAALAGSAAAQQTSPILNTVEVQALDENATPENHGRLSAHFAALGDRYDVEARRHASMARTGNPNRAGAGMNEHCRRLSALNAESAATLRELATHHQALAGGSASVAPYGGERFEKGEGAPDPTAAELDPLARAANTRAEHRGLQEYLLTLATRYTAEANEHNDFARRYVGTRIAWGTARHERLRDIAREAAREAEAAALMHGQMADIAR
jgi:hypothetical protein